MSVMRQRDSPNFLAEHRFRYFPIIHRFGKLPS